MGAIPLALIELLLVLLIRRLLLLLLLLSLVDRVLSVGLPFPTVMIPREGEHPILVGFAALLIFLLVVAISLLI